MIRPVGNRVLIQPIDDGGDARQLIGMAKGGATAQQVMSVADRAAQRRSGIQLVQAKRPIQGTVVAVGDPHCEECRTVTPSPVKVGDVVVYPKDAGLEIRQDEGAVFVLMRFDDILGTWRPEGEA